MSKRCSLVNRLLCLIVLPRGSRIAPTPNAERDSIARKRRSHLHEASPRSNKPPLCVRHENQYEEALVRYMWMMVVTYSTIPRALLIPATSPIIAMAACCLFFSV